MLHTKEYREAVTYLDRNGIKVISGDRTGKGWKLRVAYNGVETVVFTKGVTKDVRSMKNMLGTVKLSLKHAGADMSKHVEVAAEAEIRGYTGRTHLNLREKADAYHLHKATEATVDEIAETYRIHRTTAYRILEQGRLGEFDDLLPDQYRTFPKVPPKVAPGTATIRAQPAPLPEPVTATELEPTPSPTAEPEPAPTKSPERPYRPKLGPFDPRILALAAKVSAAQNTLNELSTEAAELGIELTHHLEVHWA